MSIARTAGTRHETPESGKAKEQGTAARRMMIGARMRAKDREKNTHLVRDEAVVVGVGEAEEIHDALASKLPEQQIQKNETPQNQAIGRC